MFTRYFRKKDDTSRKEANINKKANRDVTVAAVIKQTPEGNVLSFGISVCSKKDQFVRSKGRILATGRAMSNHSLTTVAIPSEATRQDALKFFVEHEDALYNKVVNKKNNEISA